MVKFRTCTFLDREGEGRTFTISNNTHLKDDSLYESIHSRGERERSALETPENDASLRENTEQVQHCEMGRKPAYYGREELPAVLDSSI